MLHSPFQVFLIKSRDQSVKYLKSSQSEEIAVISKEGTSSGWLDQEEETTQAPEDDEKPTNITFPATKDPIDPAENFTDTREVEELMDSSGVGAPVVSRGKAGALFVQLPTQGEDLFSEGESPDEPHEPSRGHSQEQRRLSVSGRTLQRK